MNQNVSGFRNQNRNWNRNWIKASIKLILTCPPIIPKITVMTISNCLPRSEPKWVAVPLHNHIISMSKRSNIDIFTGNTAQVYLNVFFFDLITSSYLLLLLIDIYLCEDASTADGTAKTYRWKVGRSDGFTGCWYDADSRIEETKVLNWLSTTFSCQHPSNCELFFFIKDSRYLFWNSDAQADCSGGQGIPANNLFFHTVMMIAMSFLYYYCFDFHF